MDSLRRVDATLLIPAHYPPHLLTISPLPYQVQDFWAHLLLRNGRNLSLGELDSFFQVGLTTSAVAARLAQSQSGYQSLGDEYWAWAKNQVMEKDVTFDGKLTQPCQLEAWLINMVVPNDIKYPSESSTTGVLDSLETKVVPIYFESDATNVTIRAPNADHDFVYKVYLDGEPIRKATRGVRRRCTMKLSSMENASSTRSRQVPRCTFSSRTRATRSSPARGRRWTSRWKSSAPSTRSR